MMQSSTVSSVQTRSSFPVFSRFTDVRAAMTAGFAVAALLAATMGACAQAVDPAAAAQAEAQAAATQSGTTPAATQTGAISNEKPAKTRKRDEKVVATKDTKREDKKLKKDNPLLGVDAKLPDKQLYDKAEDAIKHGRFDVGRLDLQTLLNTYPESQFMMPAKLAIADSWYKEGGTAALTQAEQEYKDFITFFPNAPEAAEAQMRVGDIYFKQMDKPDRDYSKTLDAEREYRLMLQQFPDSILVPQARQKLREVQEVLASREADIASFYATRTPANLTAAIARYQTVVDTYPLYSHMDDVLVDIGDLYESQAKYIRTLKLPEAGKARLEKIYDDLAANAYREVVLEHSAAPHVEDARDRLVGMGLPVPTPTPEQVAASVALENSRGQYTLSKRATVIFLHKADTVHAATIGAPPLEDAKPTLAPAVEKKAQTEFVDALNPAANTPPATPAGQPATAAADASAPATPAAPASNAPLSFQDVPSETGTGASSAAAVTNVPEAAPATSSAGTGIGVEIVPSDAGAPTKAPATPPAFPGSATPAAASDANGGVTAVGASTAAAPLAPAEKPEVAPTPINEAAGVKQPAAQAPPANGKKVKTACDKNDESCSDHKKKKGLSKLNPF
jgi:outer membrane protein assembly factor BamD